MESYYSSNGSLSQQKQHRLQTIFWYSILATIIISGNIFFSMRISTFLGSRSQSSILKTDIRRHGGRGGIVHDHGHDMDEEEFMDCGNEPSLESKLARDCVFDVFQPGWVPRVCSNDELRAEFSKLPKFEWYLDEERTKMIPQSSLEKHWEFGSRVYSDPEYHIYHCAYTMRAMTSSLSSTTRCFPKKFLNSKHTNHCINILEGKEMGVVNEVHFGKDVECVVRH